MLKQILYTLIFIFFSIEAYSINADVNLATFLADEQPYVELYLHFDASSLSYKMRDEGPSSVIEVLIIFEKNGEVVRADKYKLKSNEQVDFYGDSLGNEDGDGTMLPSASASTYSTISRLPLTNGGGLSPRCH